KIETQNRLKGRSFPFKGIIAYPPRCQGPIYYFLVFAFFSLLPILPARFAPQAREGILSVGVVNFVYLCSFLLPSQSCRFAAWQLPRGGSQVYLRQSQQSLW